MSGKAGRRSQVTGEGRSSSARLPSEYPTMVRMVEAAPAPRRPPHATLCHSFTHTIQLKKNTVNPASKNLVTRTAFNNIVNSTFFLI